MPSFPHEFYICESVFKRRVKVGFLLSEKVHYCQVPEECPIVQQVSYRETPGSYSFRGSFVHSLQYPSDATELSNYLRDKLPERKTTQLEKEPGPNLQQH